MTRKSSCYIAAALLVLLAVSTTAFAAKPVTPKLGLYRDPDLAEGDLGDLFKVVKIGGGRRGIQLKYVLIPLDCEGSHEVSFQFEELRPIPIRNGKFSFKKTKTTTSTTVLNGEEHLRYKFQISGTFKSPTKIVGEDNVGTFLTFGFPNEPVSTLTCDGDESFTANHH